MKMKKWFVEQKYFDNGKMEANILTLEQAEKKGYHDEYYKENKTHDLYVDGFGTHEQAVKFRNETLKA